MQAALSGLGVGKFQRMIMTRVLLCCFLLMFAMCYFRCVFGFEVMKEIDLKQYGAAEVQVDAQYFDKVFSKSQDDRKVVEINNEVQPEGQNLDKIDFKVNHLRHIRSVDSSSDQNEDDLSNSSPDDFYTHTTENTVSNQTTSNNEMTPTNEPTLLPWQDWSDCSETQCSLTGTQQRMRQCQINGENFDDNESCGSVSLIETQTCSNPCSNEINRASSRLSEWSDWSECSVTCGFGYEIRNRFCENEDEGSCEGNLNETRLCQVPCVWWGDWSQWSSCSRTCGVRGIRLRHRNCKGQRVYDVIDSNTEENFTEVLKRIPQQLLNRNDPDVLDLEASFCPGGQSAALESIPCAAKANCPSRWSVWGNWTECSKSCGIGFQETYRRCMGGSDSECRGNPVKFRRCYSPPCWSPWSDYTPCSKSCGPNAGFQTRSRLCRGTSLYKPEYESCDGNKFERRQCDNHICPVWGSWGAYGRCSKTCGGGIRTRFRKCIRGNCTGDATSYRKCNHQRCPTWSEWSEYTCCSRTCGNNAFKDRRRRCKYAAGSNTKCPGSSRDRVRCTLAPCNVTIPSVFESFSCGYQSNPRQASGFRIFGGRVSRENRWPWQGSWQHKTCSYCEWVHFCGATLVAPRWAITASHCIEETNFPVNHNNPGNAWSVVMGMHRLYRDGIRCFLKKIIIHPNYRYTEVTRADIALLKLREPVEMSSSISPACLPRYSSPSTGTTCYVTGWGYTESTTGTQARLATELKEARVPLLSFTACRNLGSVYQSYLSKRNHMCAGNPRSASADSCTGDSGGPLICQYRDNQWYLAGITSFGFSTCGKRGHTGIYVPITYYKWWIRTIIEKDAQGIC